MRKIPCLLLAFLALVGIVSAQERQVKIKMVETSDVHGAFFPYDFILRQPAQGSLARVSSYLNQERATFGNRLLLFDNGDILQGQPSLYYYNYIDTTSVHLHSMVTNYLQYDAGNVGNHDVETGTAVLKRASKACQYPILGANIIDSTTGQPAFQPYAVFEREGVKIAVLGLITPAIPVWLSEHLWKGWHFNDMEETARQWMKVIREKEHPDVMVGIFHAGVKAETLADRYRENASVEVATRVPGFDIVFCGHDHAPFVKQVTNCEGQAVWVVNPGSDALQVSEVEMNFTLFNNEVKKKEIKAGLVSMRRYEPDEHYMRFFSKKIDTVNAFVDRKIGTIDRTITTREAYVGSSAFVDLIHTLQLQISGAQISLAAPLAYDAEIHKGDIRVSDMFNLYKYENKLYTMRLTGQEIKDALEASYAGWTNRMTSPDDHLLRIQKQRGKKYRFAYFTFNFDSAAGINYTVDVTRPQGEKITISSLSDGTPFDPKANYLVAVNSYRGNGGGNLLTLGSGIPIDELPNRVVYATDLDLRYYLIKYVEEHPFLSPKPLNNWRFIPEEWAKPAAERDYQLLFGTK